MIVIFRWKQFSPESRQAPFESLVQFIRFPVMKPSEFTKYVIPTKVLQSQDVIDILSYFSDNGYVYSPIFLQGHFTNTHFSADLHSTRCPIWTRHPDLLKRFE